MPRRFDHVDLRVRSLTTAQPFYVALLTALGFTRDAQVPGWFQRELDHAPITEFFGVAESPGHQANENRIAFWAESVEEVDRLAAVVTASGGQNVEGPGFENPEYYAVFFEDPSGNRLEICHRIAA